MEMQISLGCGGLEATSIQSGGWRWCVARGGETALSPGALDPSSVAVCLLSPDRGVGGREAGQDKGSDGE